MTASASRFLVWRLGLCLLGAAALEGCASTETAQSIVNQRMDALNKSLGDKLQSAAAQWKESDDKTRSMVRTSEASVSETNGRLRRLQPGLDAAVKSKDDLSTEVQRKLGVLDADTRAMATRKDSEWRDLTSGKVDGVHRAFKEEWRMAGERQRGRIQGLESARDGAIATLREPVRTTTGVLAKADNSWTALALCMVENGLMAPRPGWMQSFHAQDHPDAPAAQGRMDDWESAFLDEAMMNYQKLIATGTAPGSGRASAWNLERRPALPGAPEDSGRGQDEMRTALVNKAYVYDILIRARGQRNDPSSRLEKEYYMQELERCLRALTPPWRDDVRSMLDRYRGNR